MSALQDLQELRFTEYPRLLLQHLANERQGLRNRLETENDPMQMYRLQGELRRLATLEKQLARDPAQERPGDHN